MILYQTLEQKLQEIGVPTSDASAGAADAIGELMAIAQEQRTGLTFGQALEIMKAGPGSRLSRPSWNGRGMFVVLQKAYPEGIPCNENTAEAWGMEVGDLFKVNPYLQIKNADGSHAMWVPSIGDLMAEDWEVIN